MKYSLFLFLAIIAFSCSDNNQNKKNVENESEQEVKIRLKKEQELNRPQLKGFMIESKRPYLVKASNQFNNSYTIETTVANVPGIISIEFDKDSTIGIIKFTCKNKLSLNNENEKKFEEFIELINRNYNIQISSKNYYREIINNCVIYKVGKRYSKELIDSPSEIRKLNREIEKLKKQQHGGIYKEQWDKLTQEIEYLEFKKYNHYDLFIFEIISESYVVRKTSEKIIKFIEDIGNSIKNRYELDKELKNQKMKDF